MRRITFCLSLVLLAVTLSVTAQKVTFVPQWTPQAQFAGFYVAQDMGFYADEGLDVDIVHVGLHSSESSFDMLESGRAQIVGMHTLQSIIERSSGSDIVNVMQITQKTGLCCVSHSPIKSVSDLNGKKLGKWKSGFYELCAILANRENISVEWVPFVGSGVNLYAYGAVDATLCYSYSELVRLRLAVGDIPEENILRFSELGYNIPEDALVVSGRYFKKNADVVRRFVEASEKGWLWAKEHPAEALKISMKYVAAAHVVTNDVLEKIMLDEYLKLQVNDRTGVADFAAMSEEVFDGLVEDLYQNGLIGRKVAYRELIVE